MKIKLITLIIMLITLTACVSTSMKSSESLLLRDGSNLFIDNGKVVKITDKTGAIIEIQRGKMQELANGDFIYIRRDGTVNSIGTSKSSHGHNSKSTKSSEHSHY